MKYCAVDRIPSCVINMILAILPDNIFISPYLRAYIHEKLVELWLCDMHNKNDHLRRLQIKNFHRHEA